MHDISSIQIFIFCLYLKIKMLNVAHIVSYHTIKSQIYPNKLLSAVDCCFKTEELACKF